MTKSDKLLWADCVCRGMTALPEKRRKDQRTFWKIGDPILPEYLDFIENTAKEYREPGYSDPETPLIVFGNWNYDKEEREYAFAEKPLTVGKALEELGCECEWSDEWVNCNNCYGAVRCSPTSYGWKQHYVQTECEITCVDCLLEDPTWYLKHIEGSSSKAITFDIDLEKYGYKLAQAEFENGWYGGQSDDPNIIAKNLKESGVSRFIFMIDSVGQFDLSFSLYIHKSQFRKAKQIGPIPSSGPDPAEMLSKGLRNARISGALVPDGSGVKVTKIHRDGTATTKLVSPQDFIDGKALN